MTTSERIFAGLFLFTATFVLSWFGSFAIDPAIGPWGLIGPLLFALAGGLLAIPMYRVSEPLGYLRWVVVALQLSLPIYVVVAAIHFYMSAS